MRCVRVKIALISVLLAFCVLGCGQGVQSRSVHTRAVDRIDTPGGMITYLEKQNLPALKFVDKWENKFGPGLRLVTEHYEIYTTLLEPLMLSQVPGFVESCCRAYNNQLPAPVETTSRFTIYLFAKRSQWENFTAGFAGRDAPLYRKIKIGAYYLNGVCVAYNIGREKTFSVLGHEGWHQFNSRHWRYRLPSWLDEGIAMLFEVNRYEAGLFYFEPAKNMYRLGPLKKAMGQNKIIPLGSLLAMNPGEVVGADDDAASAFYSQSYALVRFLREADYAKRLGNYQLLLVDGLNGNWALTDLQRRIAADRNIPLTVQWNRVMGPKLFQDYMGDNIRQIEDEYLQFCRKIVYHVRLK